MNYKDAYNSLIERSKIRTLEGYVEKHHIIPKCMGGSDEHDNIAILSAREHYIAHQLLVKLHPGNYKIIYAARMMTVDKTGGRINNKQYEWLTKAFLKTDRSEIYNKSIETKRKRGTGKLSPESIEKLKATLAKTNTNPEVRQRRIDGSKNRTVSPEGRAKLSAARKGNVPWNKGVPSNDTDNKKRSETQKARYAIQEHHLKGKPSPHKGKPSGRKGISSGPKEIFTCEHCGKQVGGASNYKRWHSTNCKFSP